MCSIRTFAAIIVAILALPLRAVTITTDTIISAENSFPDEALYIADGEAPPTTVQMIDGGEAQSIHLRGASILNFHGGRVAERVYPTGTSNINIRGGSIGSLYFSRSSAVGNVFGGTIHGDAVLLSGLGSPTLNVFGGRLADVVAASNNLEPFTLNIHAGYLNWIRVQSVTASSVLNITGGSFDRFSSRGRMTVDWSGGEPREGSLTLWDDSTLNVYGYNLVHRVEGDSAGYLSGTLLDGTVIDEIYVDRVANAQVVLHNVPEPSSIAIAAIGLTTAITLRRKRICAH